MLYYAIFYVIISHVLYVYLPTYRILRVNKLFQKCIQKNNQKVKYYIHEEA